MRYLLLGLLPAACTVADAAPGKGTGGEQRRPAVVARKADPIVQHGSGCQQDIASGAPKGAPGGGRGRGGVAPARAEAPDERALGDEAVGTMGGATSPSAGRPAQIAQSGVRAGEWDDNANYRDYVQWLAQPGRGAARLDVSSRQFLVVTDGAGKPVPSCAITIKGSRGSAALTSMASGRALLFPGALGLGDDLTAQASCGAGLVSAAVAIDRSTPDGVVDLVVKGGRALPAKRVVDLAFVLDTTGSMAEEIDAVKETIDAVSRQLADAQTEVRIGLVEYKDRADCVLTRTFPFQTDLAAFGRQVAGLSADGGGDTPEDMQAGLAAALDDLTWSKTSVARMVVVIADAPPHLDYQDERDYADAAKRAAARGIKLYTVSASGMDDDGQVVMRQMAQYTGASNLFVLRGGAGPQSVGGGDPMSACGGTHTEFASGNLDQLIMGKVKSELASIDGDPHRIPGRGQDENAKPCEQRLVIAN